MRKIAILLFLFISILVLIGGTTKYNAIKLVPSSNDTYALQVQDRTGKDVLLVDASTGIMSVSSFLKLTNSNNNYVVTLSAGTPLSNYTLILPADDGENGQVLTTNGSGALSWSTIQQNVVSLQNAYEGGNTIYIDTNDGNPDIRMGSSDAEEAHYQVVYDTGAKTIDHVLFHTETASNNPNKGQFKFVVDDVLIASIHDTGISLLENAEIKVENHNGAGNGGNLTLTAGSASEGNANGGVVTIYGGSKSGNGNNGYIKISAGAGTPTYVNTRDSLYIAGNLEVDSDTYLDANVYFHSNVYGGSYSNVQSFVSYNDITVLEQYGCNKGNKKYYIGVPKLQMDVCEGTNNTGYALIEDGEDASDWTATANVIKTTSSTYYRWGSFSILMRALGASNGEGITQDHSGSPLDWSDREYVGMWVLSESILTEGQIYFSLVDTGAGESTVNFPALSPMRWTFVRLDISSLANESKDSITSIGIKINNVNVAIIYLDNIFVWDASSDCALNGDIMPGGMLPNPLSYKMDAGTITALVEGTDFWIDDTDNIMIFITDQSDSVANYITVMYALE